MSKKKLHKRSVMEKDTFGLPYDILSDILIKVPVKSLLRFKSISKPWNAIISEDDFIKAHYNQSKALGRRNLLLQSKYTGEFELIDLENPKVVTLTQDQESPLKNSHVLCSLDGLVLLEINMLDETFALWNPSTRQHQTLRCPYLINSTRARACGLCYDCTVDDYKVILIYSLFYVVYSTNTDFWTMKTMFPIFEVLESYHGSRGINRGISTEGRVYWSLDWELFNQGVRKVSTIIYFDVKLDELKELPIPDFIGVNELFRLTAFKGSLSLYRDKNFGIKSDFWIMEQDGWKLSKLFNIPTLSFREHYLIIQSNLLACTWNGELILHRPEDGTLSIYNLIQQRFVPIYYRLYHSDYVYSPADLTCLDSLCFPMNKKKQLTLSK